MSAYPFESQRQEINKVALMLSFFAHVLLAGVLFYGMQGVTKPSSGIIQVEMWQGVSGPTLGVLAAPTPPPAPVPEVQESRPSVEARPIMPDITVRSEEKKKDEEIKPPVRPPAPPRPERSVESELARELSQLQLQRDAQASRSNRAARESSMHTQLGAELGSARAAANRSAMDAARAVYISKIREKVRGFIILPPSIRGNPEAVFIVRQLPNGEVIPPVRLTKSSGNRALDAAFERAILQASPLPLPDQKELFERDLELVFKPYE